MKADTYARMEEREGASRAVLRGGGVELDRELSLRTEELEPSVYAYSEAHPGLSPAGSMAAKEALSAGNVAAEAVLSVSFNQDSSCFAVGTTRGFRVFSCQGQPLRESLCRASDASTALSSPRPQIGAGPCGSHVAHHHFAPGHQQHHSPHHHMHSLASTCNQAHAFPHRPDLCFPGSIQQVEMLYRCNIMALVGGGPNPRFPANKVIIWDDNQGSCVGELLFRSDVRAVRLRRDRVAVLLDHGIYVYSLGDLRLLAHFDTLPLPRPPPSPLGTTPTIPGSGYVGPASASGGIGTVTVVSSNGAGFSGGAPGAGANSTGASAQSQGAGAWSGLCAVSQAPHKFVLACLGLQRGQVRVEHFDDPVGHRTQLVTAHESCIAALALSTDGKRLATASVRGTLARIFCTADGTMLQELRRGADRAEIYSLAFSPQGHFLALTSDKGTAHVFAVNSAADHSGPRHSESSGAIRVSASSGPNSRSTVHRSLTRAASPPDASFSMGPKGVLTRPATASHAGLGLAHSDPGKERGGGGLLQQEHQHSPLLHHAEQHQQQQRQRLRLSQHQHLGRARHTQSAPPKRWLSLQDRDTPGPTALLISSGSAISTSSSGSFASAPSPPSSHAPNSSAQTSAPSPPPSHATSSSAPAEPAGFQAGRAPRAGSAPAGRGAAKAGTLPAGGGGEGELGTCSSRNPPGQGVMRVEARRGVQVLRKSASHSGEVGDDEDGDGDSELDPGTRSNPGSSLAFMRVVLPRYFSSEWSVAQFRHLPSTSRSLVSFCAQKHTLLVATYSGRFFRLHFDPVRGGEMSVEESADVLHLPPASGVHVDHPSAASVSSSKADRWHAAMSHLLAS